MHDAGHEGKLFSSLTDAGDGDIFAEFSLKGVIGIIAVQAPEMPGVPEPGFAAIDEQVDRPVRDAGEKDAVVAGELQIGGEGAPGVGVAPASGQRGFPDHGVARPGDGVGAGQRPRDEA